MRKNIAVLCLVAVLSLGLILFSGCPGKGGGGQPGGGPSVSPSGGPAGGPPPATTGGPPPLQTGPPHAISGPPNQANSLAVSAIVSFADGTKPSAWSGSSDPRMLMFKDLHVLVTVDGETSNLSGVVRDANGTYIFGTRVMVKKDPKSYKTISKIIFRAPGYKDKVFENIPLEDLFAKIKDPVVIEKK